MKKKIIAFLLLIVFTGVVFLNCFSSKAMEGDCSWKLTDLLKQVLEVTPEGEKIPIIVEVEDVNDEEMEKILAERFPDEARNYHALIEDPTINISMEDVQK